MTNGVVLSGVIRLQSGLIEDKPRQSVCSSSFQAAASEDSYLSVNPAVNPCCNDF